MSEEPPNARRRARRADDVGAPSTRPHGNTNHMPKLVISDGDGEREVGLAAGSTLGRTSDNEIQLKIPEASRQHCRFTEEQGSWFIEDLGSSNGTKVNGRKVTKFELQDGDVIAVGNTSLKFLDIDAGPSEEEEIAIEEESWGDDEISLEQRVFVVLHGGGRDGDVIDLPQGRVTVGRNAKHAIRIKEASVSGDHAALVRDGDDVTLEDLGSSNGTFVGGRQIEQALLDSGVEVRFGQVRATFGIGDPADFADAGAAAAPVAADEDDGYEDDRLDLDAVPAGKERVWNIVAILFVLLLGGGAYYVFTMETGGADDGPKPLVKGTSNLLPDLAWSFELPEEAGEDDEGVLVWRRDPQADGLEVTVLEGSSASGATHLELLRREPSNEPAFAFLSRDGAREGISVSQDQTYAVEVQVADATARPMLVVQWMAQPADGVGARYEIARDFVTAEVGQGSNWETLAGHVVAPAAAIEARIGVGIAGGETALFDDVSMRAAPVDGRKVEANSFKGTLQPDGRLRVSRFNDLVVDGIGLLLASSGSTHDQARGMSFTDQNGALSGRVVDGTGTVTPEIGIADGKIRLTLRGDAVRAASGLRVPLPRGSVDATVTVLKAEGENEIGRRFSSSFENEPATALILGDRNARVRLTVHRGDGAPMTLPASYVAGERKSHVDLAVTGGETLVVDLQLDFTKETEKARDMIGIARSLRRENKLGQAVDLARQLVARYPFEESLAAEAATLEREILDEGASQLAEKRQAVDDAKFFRTLPEQGPLLEAVQGHAARYAGTSLAEGFGDLAKDLEGSIAAFLAPRTQAEAAVILRRGKSYADAGQQAIARLFLQTLIDRFPGSAEAEAAGEALRNIGPKSRENG